MTNLNKTTKTTTNATVTSPKSSTLGSPVSAPKAKHTPVIVDLPYGATSEYTACRHCGARFTQRDGTRRFRALAKHYVNECKG